MPLTHARHWEVLWHHNFVKGIYIKRGAEMLHVFYSVFISVNPS